MKNIVKSTCIIWAVLALFTSSSCEKETYDRLLRGDLIGFVNLRNNTSSINADNSGVTIEIEGSDPLKSTITDETGKYVINDLNSGTYNIIMKKEGFGTYKHVAYKFIGGNKPSGIGSVYLTELFNATIDSLTIESYDSRFFPEIYVRGKFTLIDSIKHPFFRCYIGNTPDVSYKNYMHTDEVYGNNGQLHYQYTIDTMQFPIGSALFMIVYPLSAYSNRYPDTETGLDIYSGVNLNYPSMVDSIKVPRPER